jgi:hypothetical protein
MTTSIERAFADYAYAKAEFDYWAGRCADSTAAFGLNNALRESHPTHRHNLRMQREWRRRSEIACARLRQAFALAEPEGPARSGDDAFRDDA